MQNVRNIHSSWISGNPSNLQDLPDTRLSLGPSLFQLVVTELEGRITSRPADIIVTLGFLAGRIVQRAAFNRHPKSFRLDQSMNGIPFLRCDDVTTQLVTMKQGSLASKLVESALLAGAKRFPDFQKVLQDANEGIQRWGGCQLPPNLVSAQPQKMAAQIQTYVDSIMVLSDDPQALIDGIFDSCGLAINYTRHRLSAIYCAELALEVALYGGWTDQRSFSA